MARSARPRRVDLIVRRLAGASSQVLRLPFGDLTEFPGHPLLYGSVTTDGQGTAYVVGALDDQPLAIRVRRIGQ